MRCCSMLIHSLDAIYYHLRYALIAYFDYSKKYLRKYKLCFLFLLCIIGSSIKSVLWLLLLPIVSYSSDDLRSISFVTSLLIIQVFEFSLIYLQKPFLMQIQWSGYMNTLPISQFSRFLKDIAILTAVNGLLWLMIIFFCLMHGYFHASIASTAYIRLVLLILSIYTLQYIWLYENAMVMYIFIVLELLLLMSLTNLYQYLSIVYLPRMATLFILFSVGVYQINRRWIATVLTVLKNHSGETRPTLLELYFTKLTDMLSKYTKMDYIQFVVLPLIFTLHFSAQLTARVYGYILSLTLLLTMLSQSSLYKYFSESSSENVYISSLPISAKEKLTSIIICSLLLIVPNLTIYSYLNVKLYGIYACISIIYSLIIALVYSLNCYFFQKLSRIHGSWLSVLMLPIYVVIQTSLISFCGRS